MKAYIEPWASYRRTGIKRDSTEWADSERDVAPEFGCNLKKQQDHLFYVVTSLGLNSAIADL